jgi:CRISPR type III-B/RAMP module RAMP protein Cmr1
MMGIRREVPAKYSTPPELPQRKDSYLDLEFRVMTALYGGGAQAGHNEVEDPFRIPSIRGQLRFWWRATAGAQYTAFEDLRKAEAAIWGSTEQASKVRLRMLSADRGTERAAAGMGPSGRWEKLQPDYALFPAQEDAPAISKQQRNGLRHETIRHPTAKVKE